MSQAINLLRWRENKGRYILQRDSLHFLMLLGFLALLIEIAISLLHFYDLHIVEQTIHLQEKLKKQTQEYAKAKKIIEQYQSLEKYFGQAQHKQRAWQLLQSNLQKISQAKPENVQLKMLKFEHSQCQIFGWSQADGVHRFVKKLQENQLIAELIYWNNVLAVNTQEPNFQINIDKSIYVDA